MRNTSTATIAIEESTTTDEQEQEMTLGIARGARVKKADARRLADAFSALQRKHGIITPDAVVDYARPESSPIHDLFTWDDAEAAAEWRLSQARHYLRVVVVVETVEGEEQQIRYVPPPVEDDAGERGYRTLGAIASSESMIARIVERMRDELRSWRRRAKAYESAFGDPEFFAAVDRVVGSGKRR